MMKSIRSEALTRTQRSIENCEILKIYPASEIVFTDSVIENGLRRIRSEAQKTEKIFRSQKNPEAASRLKQTIEEFCENVREAYGRTNIDAFIHYFYPNTMSFIDYFDNKDSIIFIDEPNRLQEKADAVDLEFREGMTGRMEKGYILPGQMAVLIDQKAIWHRFFKDADGNFDNSCSEI